MVRGRFIRKVMLALMHISCYLHNAAGDLGISPGF